MEIKAHDDVEFDKIGKPKLKIDFNEVTNQIVRIAILQKFPRQLIWKTLQISPMISLSETNDRKVENSTQVNREIYVLLSFFSAKPTIDIVQFYLSRQ